MTKKIIRKNRMPQKGGPRTNDRITAPELRVLGKDNENLGIMPKEKALARALGEGLDLIEVAPGGKPPVARIMSFDKYRYEEAKKQKKSRQAERSAAGSKRVQISARSAKNDLDIKRKRLHEFLEAGHPVELQMELFGRERAHKGWARKKLQEFMETIEVPHKVVAQPKFGGRGMIVHISPQK